MANNLIAARYAKGLNDAIEADDSAETASESLNDLAEAFSESRELATVLSNPALPRTERAQILYDVFKAVDAPESVDRLVAMLFGRRRLRFLPEVAREFARLVDARVNRVTAQVTTAMPLTSGQAERVREGLSTYSGKTVRLAASVDPDLLGGISVRMEGVALEGNLKTRLERIKTALIQEER